MAPSPIDNVVALMPFFTRRTTRAFWSGDTRPQVLVLDEPTEGIQPSIIKDIGRALQFLRDQKGMTILLVEQYLDFCREIADDIYIMDRGEIMHSGPAADLDLPEVRRHLMV